MDATSINSNRNNHKSDLNILFPVKRRQIMKNPLIYFDGRSSSLSARMAATSSNSNRNNHKSDLNNNQSSLFEVKFIWVLDRENGEEEVRKTRVKYGVKLEELREKALQLYELNENYVQVKLRFCDDEGDLVTMVADEDVEDAWNAASKKSTSLRIYLSLVNLSEDGLQPSLHKAFNKSFGESRESRKAAKRARKAMKLAMNAEKTAAKESEARRSGLTMNTESEALFAKISDAPLGSVLEVTIHDHPVQVDENMYNGAGYICDTCNVRQGRGKGLHCIICGFDACIECSEQVQGTLAASSVIQSSIPKNSKLSDAAAKLPVECDLLKLVVSFFENPQVRNELCTSLLQAYDDVLAGHGSEELFATVFLSTPVVSQHALTTYLMQPKYINLLHSFTSKLHSLRTILSLLDRQKIEQFLPNFLDLVHTRVLPMLSDRSALKTLDLSGIFEKFPFGNAASSSDFGFFLMHLLCGNLFSQPSHPQCQEKIEPSVNGTTSKSSTIDSSAVHEGVECDACGVFPIVGTRFKCMVCRDTDLCKKCELSVAQFGTHKSDHELLQIKQPRVKHRSHSYHFGMHLPYQHRYRHQHCFSGRFGEFNEPARPGRCGSNWRSTTKPVEKVELQSRFVCDVNIPDRSELYAGQSVLKIWSLENSGQRQWPKGTKLVFLRGNMELVANQDEWTVPLANAGEQVDVSVLLQAPERPGRYVAYFRLADENRTQFGPDIWTDVLVVPSNGSHQLSKETSQSVDGSLQASEASQQVVVTTKVSTASSAPNSAQSLANMPVKQTIDLQSDLAPYHDQIVLAEQKIHEQSDLSSSVSSTFGSRQELALEAVSPSSTVPLLVSSEDAEKPVTADIALPSSSAAGSSFGTVEIEDDQDFEKVCYPPSQVSADERQLFSKQLSALNDIGFKNAQLNCVVLRLFSGDLSKTVDWLLDKLGN